jgi:hypothetical protein
MLAAMEWPFRKRTGALLAFTVLGVAPWLVAAAENPERYPYDPVCAWGRLADGHGMLIRCLEPQEATPLLERPAPKPVKAPAQAPAPAAPEAPKNAAAKIAVTGIGPAQADTGELPMAVKKLSLAKDRFVECVTTHGGLSEKSGRVVVRFLVRERGRAEGVSVKSHEGVSVEAAKCIADVVDRRYVGYPAAPIVGATIPIELGAL